MKLIVEPATRPLSGTIAIPGDKSIGHRALLFSLLSATPVRVLGLGDGADNGRSAKAITALGGSITRDGAALVIHGTGLDGMRAPAQAIDCGNSGTTIRLMCGLLAGQRFQTTLFGDESLSKRPMRRVIGPLAQMGATITGARSGAGALGGPHDITPPLVIGPATAPLAAIDYALPMASAQVKTAILLAALYADGATSVTEPGPSRDHSERMLAYLGAPLAVTGRRTVIDTRGWSRRLAGDGAIDGVDQDLDLDEPEPCPLGLVAVERRRQRPGEGVAVVGHALARLVQRLKSLAHGGFAFCQAGNGLIRR